MYIDVSGQRSPGMVQKMKNFGEKRYSFIPELRCWFPKRVDFDMQFEKETERKSNSIRSYASWVRAKHFYRLNTNFTNIELMRIICRDSERERAREELKHVLRQTIS